METITLPGDFASTTLSYTQSIFTGLGPYISLIVGTVLALLVINVIVNVFNK